MISTAQYKTFQDLTLNDLDILKQAYQRLVSEGLLQTDIEWSDFFDAILAQGSYQTLENDKELFNYE